MSVGKSISHESAEGHVTGAALYTDDLVPRYPGCLHAWPIQVMAARARVDAMHLDEVRSHPGVVAVLTADDVPGENDTGAARRDEALFPVGETAYWGQAVAWVLAESEEAAKIASLKAKIDFTPLEAITTIEQAIEAESFHTEPSEIARGDLDAAFRDAPHTATGQLYVGGQEHFYLETQAAIADVDEAGSVLIQSSTQHPTETQEIVARVLGIPRNQVVVQSLRMGGAFGGKEVQANPYSDGGWSLDLSAPVFHRALFHADNAYYLPNVRVRGRVCKTNVCSHTAFRGFGGPQGMLMIEDAIDRVARAVKLPPHAVRQKNFYRPGHTTHYEQKVEQADRIERIWDELRGSSQFDERFMEIEAFNAKSAHLKRGVAITPVKFGISFTAKWYNQAGALVLVYRDGSVQVNHGGTEMGQGLHTKMLQIAAHSLGLPLERVRIMPTRTDKVPNTSATAASSGSDLNGAAVLDACEQIKDRLRPIAARMLDIDPDEVEFGDGEVRRAHLWSRSVPFAEVVEKAYMERVQLSATGFYKTPRIHFDAKAGRGKPFHYFAYGAAVTEVEVDGFTGMYTIKRVDILHDCGTSLSPLVDLGQVEGGFIQGLGWVTQEELWWADDGRLGTSNASTYKLPTLGEAPEEMHVSLLPKAEEPGVVYGSKAVGEPPFMLAISAREAIRHAVSAFASAGEPVELACPATPEKTYWAIEKLMAREAKTAMKQAQAVSGAAE